MKEHFWLSTLFTAKLVMTKPSCRVITGINYFNEQDYMSCKKIIPLNFLYTGQNFDKAFVPSILKVLLQSTLNPTLWMTFLPQNVPLITSIQKNLLLFKELFLSPVYIMYLLFLLIPGWLKKFLMHQNVWTGIIPWIVVKWVGESKKCFLMFSEVNCFCEYINMKVPTEAFILPGFLKLQQNWKYLSFFYCLMSPVDRGSKAHCKPQSKALSRTKPLSHCQ